MSKYIHLKGKDIVFPVNLIIRASASTEEDGWVDLILSHKLTKISGSDEVLICIEFTDFLEFLESNETMLEVYS